MQPPTARPAPAPRRGDEEALYRRYHRALQRTVADAVHGTPELIEDACQTAWSKLLRNQPHRDTFFGWLRVVAIHEAYRLSAIERRDLHLEDLPAATNWEAVTIDPRASIDDALEARAALELLASLPPRQRHYLTLLIAGFSYEEIRHLAGGRTYTNVNKHLVKARALIRLAQLRDARANSQRPDSS
jgi:DNA-directed RNA polymerase specialized sigma24 family protein